MIRAVRSRSEDFGEFQSGEIMEGVTRVSFTGDSQWLSLYLLKKVHMCGTLMLIAVAKDFRVCGGYGKLTRVKRYTF